MATRRFTVACTSIALVLGLGPAFADPGKGKGQGHGNSGDHKESVKHDDYHGGPSINRGDVLRIVNGYTSYWTPGSALPPGIKKNLARGKPLPPGIAKKLDGRLISQLPYYEGYQWMQAGADLILVAVATGIIYEVLDRALD
ncbi:anti-virulence regulator CigR family protein [Pseudomonas plecoglossicida]|uniref:Nickel/cobalt transporter regulator n=1 Tax=Pseudomonas plecoglossicida TaxID=70775 RepID=A0AAD0QV16_PSEDL|nr:anti-virulence regulator CigR family protein [Pseudomonas plecoglossicida]AXM94744.1 hypothetical protein DVB73_02325 [Pseudomonas plecoglossicida]EPB96425.1 hypothetical protein L321_08385 [Pseudomonas plecoglossicida NB2011]QLB55485.1 hypothetical protein HAV28_11865 [Pseudomonas plecoglossicida]GLR35833.1 hypothetical protein GCM10011247_12300 [Pseudomonas plecoglossicida]